MFTITLRKLVRKIWGSSKKAAPPRRATRLGLEALEDRTLPSAPQAIVSLASPPAAPPVAAMLSWADSTMEQWGHLVATIQQDVIGEYEVLSHEIVQAVYSVEQQVGRLFGINLTPATTSNTGDSGSGRGNASGSGSGTGAMTSGHNTVNQGLNNTKQQSGSGSGSGSSATSGNENGPQHGGTTGQPMSGSGSCGSHDGTLVGFGASGAGSGVPEEVNCNPNLLTIPVYVTYPDPNCAVSVDYATSDGTALAGTDYLATSGTLGFAAGSSGPDYINIQILDDGNDESVGSEYFIVTLSNAQNAMIAQPAAIQVKILEGPQQAATDTLRWNPCMGNNASNVQNWYDVSQGQGFQLQKGAIGPNPSSPIQFDANPADTPNSNAPITWDQSYTVASISLNQYTGKQTINANDEVETKGTNGTALSMDGKSNLYLNFNSGSIFQIDNNATITNMELTGGGQGFFKIIGGTTTIAQSSSYAETTEVPIIIASGATVNDQGYTSLMLKWSSIGITVNGEMDVLYGTGDGITLIDTSGLAGDYINVSGGTLKYLGSGNTTTDSFAVPVNVTSGGEFRLTVADGQPDGGTLIVPSVNMSGSNSTVQLAFGDTLECDNGYSQSDGTLETTDNSTCTLKVGGTGQGNATVSGGTVWVDTKTNSYGTLIVKGNLGMAGQLAVSIQGYAPTGASGTSDLLDVRANLNLAQASATLYVNGYGQLQKTATDTDFWVVISANNNIQGDFSSESSNPQANLNYGPPNNPDATKYRITYAG